MKYLSVLLNYFIWHYSRGVVDLLINLKNLIVFLYHFFSLPILSRTLIAPWRRLGEAYPARGFNLGAIFSAFFINSIMRLVGFLIRFVVISVGLLILLLAIFVAVILMAIWLVLPPAVAYGLFLSFYLIFS